MSDRSQLRLVVLGVLIVSLIATLVARVFYLQLVVGEEYAAQAAVNEALRSGPWVQVDERRFEMPAHFADFAVFEQRLMRPTTPCTR